MIALRLRQCWQKKINSPQRKDAQEKEKDQEDQRHAALIFLHPNTALN